MANGNNNSDYTKKNVDLLKYLPETYKSDVNKSVFGNLLNRFLTKIEADRVAGYIGKGNSKALIKRQIVEPNVHRQAFQLQPIVYNKIGSTEHIVSWKDIVVELERLGVDTDLINSWGELLQFNWVPPVDIDKLVHYSDYYWVNTTAENSKPQYITIRSRDRDMSQCSALGGWDLQQWDDTLSDADRTTFINSISHTTPPAGPGTNGQLWYNTTTDILHQYNGSTWVQVWTSFSSVIVNSNGQALWDLFNNCPATINIPAVDQWSSSNFWVHKTEVTNFTTAKQAQFPIIEYQWDLELNEWAQTNYEWKYRASFLDQWSVSTSQPSLFELMQLDLWTVGAPNEIIFHEKYGDLTNVFSPGFQFMALGTTQEYIVDHSVYKADVDGQPYKTRVVLTVALNTTSLVPATLSPVVPSTTPLHPRTTSRGDTWKGYGQHWLFVGVTSTQPVNHQIPNPFVDITSTTFIHDAINGYDYRFTYYAQEFNVTTANTSVFYLSDVVLPGTSKSLRQRALLGHDDVRVYVDGVRQYGTYDEIDALSPHDGFVDGISFLTGYEPKLFSIVRVEVGEASIDDLGLSAVPVRMESDDTTYASVGDVIVSLTRYKKNEQIKTAVNQYPLFDIYNVDGTSHRDANAIFGYKTDSSAPIANALGLRAVYDNTTNDFQFDQFLLSEDNGKLYAYRDYSNLVNSFWFDTTTNVLYFWDKLTWNTKTRIGLYYIPAYVSNATPTNYIASIPGSYWFDTHNMKLWTRSSDLQSWNEIPNVTISASDESLQTIWRKGLNNETYVPEQVDWNGRTQAEYNVERDAYVASKTVELWTANSSWTQDQARTQATADWYTSQVNAQSPTGVWVGDWEIPDPLYYNNLSENRKFVSTRELLTHFTTIIQAQPTISGYTGTKDHMFHLIPANSVNYGLGGKIKQYNSAFGTFLSSIFNDTVTPVSLIDFARDQYEMLTNSIQELYLKNLTKYLTDVTQQSIANFSDVVSTDVLKTRLFDDNLASVYGDTTTAVNAGGVKNWIATLPYLQLAYKQKPVRITDSNIGVNAVVHHDGHIKNYSLPSATLESIVRSIIATADPRTSSNGHVAVDTFGRISSSLPPNTIDEFATTFNTSISNRGGVYWYYAPNASTRVLYRLNVVSTGTTTPPSTLPDGSLWMDMTSGYEALRQKQTNASSGIVTWPVVSGLSIGDRRLHNGSSVSDLTTATISAWQVMDLSSVLADTIYDIEMQLYDNVPSMVQLRYDTSAIGAKYPTNYNTYMLEAFSTYALSLGITSPLSNSNYSASDPFTWNYKHSIINLYPRTNNVVATSGGDWRDLYQKLFGTPYPHLEPWILQGYTDKPDWWDGEYLNTDTTTWGSRRWKYKHGFDITNVNTTSNYFEVVGNFASVFQPGISISVDQSNNQYDGTKTVSHFTTITSVETGTAGSATLSVNGNVVADYFPGVQFVVNSTSGTPKGTFTVKSRTFDSVANTTTITVVESIATSSQFDVIGSRYNPTTGTTLIKITTSITSSIPAGRISLLTGSPLAPHGYGMWENIRRGIIPSGQLPPAGITTIPTYAYLCVNVGNTPISPDGGLTVYGSDDVFPPYLNYSATGLDAVIRSVFTTFSTEIVAPGASYTFGDAGPVEWEWKTSYSYLYDQCVAAFRLDPINFIASAFGFDILTVNGLEIDRHTETVPRHITTEFHGEVTGSSVFQVNGLNQWYINYLRYTGHDASFSNFRTMWTSWTAPLTYQFSSFIDTTSFDLSHKYVSVTENDYAITAKRSIGVADAWFDVFNVSVLSIPPKLARYDNQLDWRLQVNTNLPISRTIEYYAVHNYQFQADPTTDVCTLYRWNVVGISATTQLVSISGDQTDTMVSGRSITLTNTHGNDGTYTVASSVYEAVTNTTLISLQMGTLVDSSTGTLTANYRSLPWKTGDIVYLSTADTLPSPLLGDTVNGLTAYFIIALSNNTFKLANTLDDALAGNAIDIISSGTRDHFVGSVRGTFTAIGGQRSSTIWRHYEVDTSLTLTLTTPQTIQGMQTLVNIVDGYDRKVFDAGWRVNNDSSLRDPDTSNLVSWQVEVERFINFAYGLQIVQYAIMDKQSVSVNPATDIWTFATENLQYITGDAVSIFSGNGLYPEPIIRGVDYFMIRDTMTTFRLAASKRDALAGIPINITNMNGANQLYITPSQPVVDRSMSQEINPIRTSVWYRPSQGIVSNIITGPYADIRTAQLIFDQYGRALKVDALHILREDQITQIRLSDGITNDVEYQVIPNAYKYIHIGGAHVFLDTYEHVLKFNGYTTDDALIYDPFIGLNVTKFELLFNRGTTFTGRPNVGGYYLSTFHNQGMDLNKNIEANVESLRYMYDTYTVDEKDPFVRQTRKLLGYEGARDYLNLISVNDKSQFLFWKGLIQYKGSKNAVSAFINSRRFIDAKVDEFWAIKIADYGSIGEKSYPELYLTIDDTRTNDFRVQFTPSAQAVDSTFVNISAADSSRWYDHPSVVRMLSSVGSQFKFDTKVHDVFDHTITGSPIGTIRHGLNACDVTVTVTDTLGSAHELTPNVDYRVINANIIEVIASGLTGTLRVWAIVVDTDSQNPAKLLDKESSTVLTPIQHWDPAHGHHYYAAIHNVELQNDTDPAVYSLTPRTQDFSGDTVDTTHVSPWGEQQIGTTWMDLREVDYVPYFDTNTFPSINDRASYWGQLSDWSSINVYEWIKSDVPPSSYDTVAALEAGNVTIPEQTRKSGIARKSLFEWNGSSWSVMNTKVQKLDPSIDGTPGSSGTYTFVASSFVAGDVINVYVNGMLSQRDVTVPVGKVLTATCKRQDYVQVVQLVPVASSLAAGNSDAELVLTRTELFTSTLGQTVIPLTRNATTVTSVVVGGATLSPTGYTHTTDTNTVTLTSPLSAGTPISVTYGEKLKYDYEYSTGTEFTSVGIQQTYYYFWVKSKSTRNISKNRTIPNSEVEKTLANIPVPYIFYQHPEASTTFSQVVIRGLRGWIDANRRYTIRFTRDFTLRDTLDSGTSPLSLKNKHEEWELFREGQEYHIMRSLWDKITEAMVGYSLIDSSIRVPSYERELYDSVYGTDTRYGLDDGQAFTDGQMAIDTITADLMNPNNSFYPIDIDQFFSLHNFDTPENIIAAMDVIYNTFEYTHVNRMMFAVLHDAFSLKSKYPGIFKTSMISLNGIRPLQDTGIFDD